MIHQVHAAITTAADGSATVYAGSVLYGQVHAIFFDIGALANTIDLVITGETTGVPILTDSPAADEWFYPRAFPNQNTDGAVEADALEPIIVLNERIKIVVAQGGNAATGDIYFYIDDLR